MKKLITICFVMLAGTVNAGFSLHIDYQAMKLSVDGQADADVYMILGGIGAPLNNFVKGPDAPSMSGYTDSISNWSFLGLNPALQGEVWVIASAPGEKYKIGTYLTANYTDKVKWASLYTYNENTNELICWFPEPSTISLFIVGMYFTRKKSCIKIN